MAKVELKQPIVQEISENIKDAQSVVVVDYRGLTVAEDTQLNSSAKVITAPSSVRNARTPAPGCLA